MSSMSEVVAKIPFDRKLLPQDFHMPGIEPWIAAILKRRVLRRVLDVGVGMGFWGYIIRSYITRNTDNNPEIIGLDLEISKLYQLKK